MYSTKMRWKYYTTREKKFQVVKSKSPGIQTQKNSQQKGQGASPACKLVKD